MRFREFSVEQWRIKKKRKTCYRGFRLWEDLILGPGNWLLKHVQTCVRSFDLFCFYVSSFLACIVGKQSIGTIFYAERVESKVTTHLTNLQKGAFGRTFELFG